MTLLPEVQSELVAAAERRAVRSAPRSTRRRSGRTLLVAATVVLTAAGTASAVLVATGVVGGRPSVPYPRIAGEESSGMVRTRTPVVLGVARLPVTGRVEVVGYTMRGFQGRGTLLCVDLVLPNGSKGGACSRDVPARASGLGGTGDSRNSRAPKLATGAAEPEAHSVEVRFRRDGSDVTRRAVLVSVTAKVTARLGTRPFGYYLAEVPSSVRSFVAVARTQRGDVLWRARFPPSTARNRSKSSAGSARTTR